MAEPILHHYDLSPFAEKIRLAFGVKNLAWRSVQTPMVLPKPDHFELTGGYRRVPVLQMGADAYCDTHLIVRVLDQRFGAPAALLSPAGREGVEQAVSRWVETSFMCLILTFFGLAGVFSEEFVEDRRRTMIPPGMDLDATPKLVPTKLAQLSRHVAQLEAMLADGRDWLLGESVSAADLSAYHPLMMFAAHPRTAALLDGADAIGAWMVRVRAIGHGQRTELEAAAAIAIAAEAEPAAFEGEPFVPQGLELGQPVVVVPDEYGSGHVTGTLAASDLDTLSVRRETERAGTVVVHFPREDYAALPTG